MQTMIEFDTALAIIAEIVKPLEHSETLPLSQACGRALAADIVAPRSLPPYTSTGVDGYAFRHADLGEDRRLRLSGTAYAGQQPDTLAPGTAARIATGGMLPEGADTVAMQEDCTVGEATVTIRTVPAPGSNIRPAGGDIAEGAVALKRGHRLRAQDIAFLGALGVATVSVFRPVRVAIVSTGEELAKPGDALAPGQIVDTNAAMLADLLRSPSVTVKILEALPDNFDWTRAALKSAARDYDLMITTGGVSVGDRDYVRDALQDLGTVHFWKIKIRPGKPVMFGSIGDCLMLGLPGNPVSAFVTALLLAKPLIAGLCGGKVALPPAFMVPLLTEIEKPAGLRHFQRARLVSHEGGFAAEPYPEQGSNLFSSLVAADGLIDLSIEENNLSKDTFAKFYLFH